MSAISEQGKDRDVIQSIERGFAVLLAFDADLPRPSLAELAARTELSRPAVRRILITLQKLGYVEPDGARWTLTPRVLTIGQHYAATHGIVDVAQPHLMRLAERTGESASLAQLDGAEVIYVARVHVRRVLSLNVDVGTRVPAYATSMGRVLAAYAEESTVARIIEAGMPALTAWTVTDPVAFRDRLHDTRRAGYAIVDSELEDGFLSAAVPVRDATGEVIAALAYSTARGRHTAEDLAENVVPLLVETASAIGADLQVLPERSRRLRVQERSGFY